jgi:hypothetical protein
MGLGRIWVNQDEKEGFFMMHNVVLGASSAGRKKTTK